ncbi:MAG: hypothetical protein H6876_04410 [Hyphomicrobiaceae bacterium]|nr:hypothetical protein [Hyphomicrobiaceae bacterium]MCC0007349.1 hypothetical protein [Hyphomicrobiaceae bacterium]
MNYSDQTLLDFLNGKLPDATRREIEADLLIDQDLERRVMALDDVAPIVAEAFKQIPGPERVERLAKTIAPAPRRPWRSAPLVAGLAASIVVCALATFYLFNAQQDWRNVVAQYQSLYVPETVANLNIDASQMKSDLERAAAAVRMPLSLDAIGSVDGLKLRRIQTLGFKGQPVIQILYTDQAGMPIAFCLTTGDDGTAGSATRTGLASYSWGAGTHQFMIIGPIDQTDLNRLAAILEKRVRGTV